MSIQLPDFTVIILRIELSRDSKSLIIDDIPATISHIAHQGPFNSGNHNENFPHIKYSHTYFLIMYNSNNFLYFFDFCVSIKIRIEIFPTTNKVYVHVEKAHLYKLVSIETRFIELT